MRQIRPIAPRSLPQWTARRPETDYFGVRLEGAPRLTPRLFMFAHASATRRNCRGCNWLDGPVGDILVGASWAALSILRVGGHAGYNWRHANAEHWRNRGLRAGPGATLALPAGFTPGLRASLQRAGYQDRA